MTTVENNEQIRAHINDLPDEILINIFQYLPSSTLLSCELVCSRWNKLVKDPAVWKYIVLIYNESVGDKTTECIKNVISSHSECIQCLQIIGVSDYKTIKSMMLACTNLFSLQLHRCRVDKEFEDDILKVSKLRKLNLSHSFCIYADIAIQFDKLKYLDYLALSTSLNPENCYSLLKCCHLRYILIGGIADLDIDLVKSLISSKKSILKALHLYGDSAVDDCVLHLLSQCTQLEYLGIDDCNTLSDEGLLFLRSFNTIKHLELYVNGKFSESALCLTFASSALPTIECLILDYIDNLTPALVHPVTENHQNLRYLRLNFYCIRNIDYENEFQSKYGQD